MGRHSPALQNGHEKVVASLGLLDLVTGFLLDLRFPMALAGNSPCAGSAPSSNRGERHCDVRANNTHWIDSPDKPNQKHLPTKRARLPAT